MKTSRALVAGCVLMTTSLAASQDPPRPIWIENVNVIPMDRDRIVRDVEVVITNGTIAATGRPGRVTPPEGAERIDAGGGFLIPGLWDMHVHVRTEADLALLLANGVTGARDMFGSPETLELRDRIARGELSGPDLVVATPILEGEPPPELASVIATEGRVMVRDATAAAESVRELAAAGYDFVKVYNNVPPDAYAGIIAEAKRHSLPVAGHVPFGVGLRGVFDSGQASIEHLRGYVWELVPHDAPQTPGADLRSRTLAWAHADEERIDALAGETAARGAWNTPTLTVGLLFETDRELEAYLRGPESPYLSDETKDWMRHRTERIPWLSNFSDADFVAAARGKEKERLLVAALARAGAPLLAGTDRAPWGFSLHTELRELVDAGLTTTQALAAATSAPADYLGKSAVTGRVVVGAPADLVLLGGNPIDDIDHTRDIRAVIRRGRHLDRAALDALIRESVGER